MPKDGTYTMLDHLQAVRERFYGELNKITIAVEPTKIAIKVAKAIIKVKEAIIGIILKINTEQGILEGSVMSSSMAVKQGDSTDIFEISVEGVTDYTEYRGKVQILKPKTNEVVSSKMVIEPVDGKISVAFSPGQTEVLAPGTYNVVMEVIKDEASVVVFRKELTWPLKVAESLLN